MSAQFDEKQCAFKAWIDTATQDHSLKLHVHGQLLVDDETLLYQLQKKIEQGFFEEELFLIITPEPTPGNGKVLLKYHENIVDVNRYKKISILTSTGQIFEIKEISK